MLSARQTTSGYFSPVTSIVLLINVLIFASFFWLATQATRENIYFIDDELQGLAVHHRLMQHYVNQPSEALYVQMRDIGDSSNLILDPEIGSYYLMNLVIRLMPDMLAIPSAQKQRSDGLLMQRLAQKSARSLEIVSKAGIDVASLQALLAQANSQPNASDAIERLYLGASDLLKQRLQTRRAEENKHWEYISLTILGLYLFASVLSAISLTHYLRQKAFRAAQEKLVVLDALEKVNAELESFSYFMAHDLKEPVRTVACFSALLGEELNMSKNSAAAKYLSVVEQSSKHMAQLIEGTLCYLATHQQPDSLSEKVDVNEVATAVVNDLQQAILESGASIDYDALPTLFVPPLALRRVLQNLISNAICYHKPDGSPVIRLRGEKTESGWKILVQDNGIGFDQQFAKQAFEPFRRLHDASAVRGSGIGLSICKKLVEGWGGEIGVFSVQGEGSCFYFTVPQVERSS